MATVCLALAPEFHGAYRNRGLAHLRLKQNAPALADLDRAIELDGTVAEAYQDRALARQRLKQYGGAVQDLTRALELGAAPTQVYFLRAVAREGAGDVEGARRDQEEGMRRRPTDEKSWIARGFARMNKDPQAGLADFDQALALNPRSRSALQNKAHLLAEKLQRSQEALAVLDRFPGGIPMAKNQTATLKCAKCGKALTLNKRASRVRSVGA